jgi:hypothetical protein
MHHPDAAQPLLMRLAHEPAQGLAGLVRAKAVQVNLPLNAPMAFAQLARHIRAQPRAAVAQGFVGVQQGFNVEFVRQRLAHHGRFVQLALTGQWVHGPGRVVHTPRSDQRLHRAHSQFKQPLLPVQPKQPPALSLLRSRFGGRPLDDHLLQRLEFGERAQFHGDPFSRRSADPPVWPVSPNRVKAPLPEHVPPPGHPWNWLCQAMGCVPPRGEDAKRRRGDPRNCSWTDPSGLSGGALARRDDAAGYLPARRSNAASALPGGSIGSVALSPLR